MNKRSKSSRAYGAYPILVEVAKNNEFMTGDDLMDALLANSYNRDDMYQFIGPLIKMGKAEGLITPTERCVTSKRNRSSLQRLWRSEIWRPSK